MEVILRKVGNSTAVVVPAPVLRDLGMTVGQRLTLATTPDGKIVLAAKNRYRLADLIAQCNSKAPPPADLELWDHARPVGQEAWDGGLRTRRHRRRTARSDTGERAEGHAPGARRRASR